MILPNSNFLIGILLMLMNPSFSKRNDANNRQPHIVLIYPDDLGWNDVSFHGSPQIPTPNIDALAMSGILLNNYYAQWLCTPSRGSLMTGKYPIRLGLQHNVISAGEVSALPLDLTILPQHLQKLGYETHMVGKWHLGYYKSEYTPTHRGFKTHIGYMNGATDYYDYTYNTDWYPGGSHRTFFGVDLRDGDRIIKNFRNQYATTFYAERARDVILHHNTAKPLFLYVAQTAVHASASSQHLQAPPEVVKKFKYISDKKRRIYAGVTSVLDDSVGVLFQALHQKGMLRDTIILFLSDNGGETRSLLGGYGSNFPLRGNKYTVWEGGLRVPAFIWSPIFKIQEPRISTQLMSVCDWLPTLYRAAGGDPNDLGQIDGHNMWEALIHNLPSPRSDLLYNVDPISGTSAYKRDDLKVINGTTYRRFDSWYGPSGFEDINPPPSMNQWVFKNGSPVRDILVGNGLWIAKYPDEWYKRSTVTCQQPPPESRNLCDPSIKPCLFNITKDPCEYKDLANEYPELVKSTMDIIHEYGKVAMKPQSKPVDLRSDPMCHNFTYVSWLDPEHFTECDYLS